MCCQYLGLSRDNLGDPEERVGHTVGIVGATGAVGHELLRVLEQRRFPVSGLRPFASARSAGGHVAFAGQQVEVEPLEAARFEGCSLVFFAAGGGISRDFAPQAVERGAVVIDNSSAFRRDPDVPLVVPEVNADDLRGHRGLIANPNCTTILLVVVLAPLHRAAGLKRVVVATYQAASGAGAQAMAELEEQSRVVLDGGQPAAQQFPKPLAFNLLPHIDVFLPEEDNATREEMKVVWESRKILGLPALPVVSTCARVPVLRAHSEAVFLELERHLDAAQAREVLAGAAGVTVVDDPAQVVYPTPRQADGQDDVLVGRIRRDPTVDHGLCLFLSGDQLRKGAALNAVQIAEALE
jgi:aspartate-semialdehyde dehydrogenase